MQVYVPLLLKDQKVLFLRAALGQHATCDSVFRRDFANDAIDLCFYPFAGDAGAGRTTNAAHAPWCV
jgi:hypothetical protein